MRAVTGLRASTGSPRPRPQERRRLRPLLDRRSRTRTGPARVLPRWRSRRWCSTSTAPRPSTHFDADEPPLAWMRETVGGYIEFVPGTPHRTVVNEDAIMLSRRASSAVRSARWTASCGQRDRARAGELTPLHVRIELDACCPHHTKRLCPCPCPEVCRWRLADVLAAHVRRARDGAHRLLAVGHARARAPAGVGEEPVAALSGLGLTRRDPDQDRNDDHPFAHGFGGCTSVPNGCSRQWSQVSSG